MRLQRGPMAACPTSLTRCRTAISSSPPAAVSARNGAPEGIRTIDVFTSHPQMRVRSGSYQEMLMPSRLGRLCSQTGVIWQGGKIKEVPPSHGDGDSPVLPRDRRQRSWKAEHQMEITCWQKLGFSRGKPLLPAIGSSDDGGRGKNCRQRGCVHNLDGTRRVHRAPPGDKARSHSWHVFGEGLCAWRWPRATLFHAASGHRRSVGGTRTCSRAIATTEHDQPRSYEEIIVSRQLIVLTAIALIAVAGALRPNPAAAMQVSPGYGPGPIALNPQPLPPGFRFNPGPHLFPHCHGVQIGDPRTHPPVRVCN